MCCTASEVTTEGGIEMRLLLLLLLLLRAICASLNSTRRLCTTSGFVFDEVTHPNVKSYPQTKFRQCILIRR